MRLAALKVEKLPQGRLRFIMSVKPSKIFNYRGRRYKTLEATVREKEGGLIVLAEPLLGDDSFDPRRTMVT